MGRWVNGKMGRWDRWRERRSGGRGKGGMNRRDAGIEGGRERRKFFSLFNFSTEIFLIRKPP